MLHKIYKLKYKIVIVLILLLIVLQLITAYIFGFITQNQMNQQFNFLKNSALIKVQSYDYHRGVFSSDVTAKIQLNNNTVFNLLKIIPMKSNESLTSIIQQNYSIQYTTHIEHGIFAGILNGYFHPTFAYATTHIIYPNNILNMLNNLFQQQPPLIIENILYLNKSGQFNIQSPEFNYAEPISGINVVWKGMQTNIQYNEQFNKFHIKTLIPLLSINVPTKGKITLNNLTYNANSDVSANKLHIGNTKLAIQLLQVNWQNILPISLRIGDMINLITGIDSVSFLNSIDTIQPNDFTFNNIVYLSKSADVDNYFSFNSIVNITQLINHNITYGPMHLAFTMNHIASKPLSTCLNQISNVIQKNRQVLINSDNFMQEFAQYCAPILVESPILSLDSFTFKTPSGLIDVHGLLTTYNFHLADINDQNQLLQKIRFTLHLALPKSILNYLLVLQMRYLLSAGNAHIDQQSSIALNKVVNILLNNQINLWQKKGYLLENDNNIITDIKFNNGMLYLNNKLSK